MFSGKTTRGFEFVRGAIMGRKKAAVIKYAQDTRYDRRDMVSSHDGRCMRAIVAKSLVEDPVGLPENVNLIFVDEGQFQEGLAAFCMRQNKLGRDVVVAALNSQGDATRSPWKPVMELLPLATRCETLTSICTICQGVANCSRHITGSLTTGGVNIGTDNKYVATCAQCYEAPLPAGVLEDRAERVAILKALSK
jgi:thymidine kinase